MEEIDFWVHFVGRNSKKLQKLGLKGKNQLHPQFVHIANFLKQSYFIIFILSTHFALWTMHDEHSAIISKVHYDSILSLKFVHNF